MVRGFRRDPVGAGSEASQAKVSVLIAEGLTSASLAMDTPEIPGGDRRSQRFSILVHHLARNDSFRGEEDLMDEALSPQAAGARSGRGRSRRCRFAEHILPAQVQPGGIRRSRRWWLTC